MRMFLGHYGVALGSKKAAPSVSLGTLNRPPSHESDVASLPCARPA